MPSKFRLMVNGECRRKFDDLGEAVKVALASNYSSWLVNPHWCVQELVKGFWIPRIDG